MDLRDRARGAATHEEAARRIVHYFYDALRDESTGGRECVLVRFYRTVPFSALGPELQSFARDLLVGHDERPDLRCLTLLATAGVLPQWNDRRQSRHHQTIPLPAVDVVERAPMVAALIRDLGVDIETLVAPAAGDRNAPRTKTYEVFHVEQARGSPVIPDQAEFVVRHGIESVLGFGGHTGDELFAIVVFSAVRISPDVAARFRTLALDVRSALLGIRDTDIFEPEDGGSEPMAM